MTMPRDLEPQLIASKLLNLLNQTEMSSHIANFVKNLAPLTESVTSKQAGVYKDAIGVVNKQEKDNILDKGLQDIEKNTEQAKENLVEGSKLFNRTAPEETQQRYLQFTSPSSSSQR